jgi:uncharacterized RDD family membrane protein YckC
LEGKQISEDRTNGSGTGENSSEEPEDTPTRFHGHDDPPDLPQPILLVCSRCEEEFAPSALMTYRERRYCATCKQDYFQHFAQGTLPAPGDGAYLFLKRLLAKFIDVNIGCMFFFCAMNAMSNFGIEPHFQALVFPMTLIVYGSITVWSTARYGGTPGKLVFKLAVVDAEGFSIGFGHAFGRLMAEGVSVIIFGIGYLMAMADPGIKTLHDRICQTRVLPLAEVPK